MLVAILRFVMIMLVKNMYLSASFMDNKVRNALSNVLLERIYDMKQLYGVII